MRRLKQQGGFTIVELLVAVTVLAIGIGATITVLVSSGKAGSTAERHNVGIEQAQQAIEQVRALPYNQVGLTGTPPGGVGTPDPTTRVSGTRFNPVGSSQESMVLPGDSKVPSPQVAPYNTVTVGSGSSATTAKIYRFVTWRNENCALLGGTNLSLLGGAGGTVSTLNGLVSNLNSSALSPALGTLVGNINGATTNLSGLLNALLGSVLTAANGIVNKGADLKPTVTSLQSTISSTASSLTSTANSLNNIGQLNLCNLDLSVLNNVKTQVSSLSSLLSSSALTTVYNSLSSNLSNVSGLFNGVSTVNCGALNLLCLVNGLVGTLLVNTNNALANVTTGEAALKNQLAALTGSNGFLTQTASAVTSLNSSVAALTASASNATPKSSKRVTVAVVLNPAGSVGPSQPIWMSTVIADPNAGLL